MKPEVLAWALLFVVSFSVVYRLIAWLFSRFAHKPAPLVSAPADTAAPPEAPAPAETPEPRVALPPPMPLALSPVISARIAATAVRSALAPSVAATLPPLPERRLDATLAPSEIEPVKDVAVAPSGLLSAEPTAAPIQQTDIPAATPGVAGNSVPLHRQTPILGRTVQLRARRIGVESLSLDSRLRDSRERRIQQIPRTSRGACELAALKELKVLAAKAAPDKIPARRIGQKAPDSTVLASSRAPTRIIGAAQRPSRILPNPVV